MDALLLCQSFTYEEDSIVLLYHMPRDATVRSEMGSSSEESQI
jgi:hypothetical protein